MRKILLALTAVVAAAIVVAVPAAMSANNITDGLAVAPLYHYGPNPAGLTVPALSPRTLPSGLVTVTYNDGQDRLSSGHSRFTASLLVTNALPNKKYVLDIRYWAFGPQSELGTLTTNAWGTGAALFSVSDVTPTPGFYIDISVKGGGTGAGGYGDTFIAGPFTLSSNAAKPTGGTPAVTLTGNGNATSTTITTADTVLYAGKYSNGLPNATVGLKVFHGYGCGSGQDFYTDASYTTTDASGNYSKESGTPPGAGLYSARTNAGTTLSNCINITVDGGSEPALTLTGNGNATSTTITTAGTVLYAGTYTNGGLPVPNATVGLTVFQGYGCATGTNVYTDASYTTTDASGNYSKMSGSTTAGLYSARTNVGSNLSNCINIAVNNVAAVDAFTLSLAITPGTIPAGTVDPVTFSGTLTNSGPTPVSGTTVTVTPYGTDPTCTTSEVWGPWTATTDATGHYQTAPIPTGAPAGVYYYKASSNGVASGCEHFTIA